MSAIRVLRLLEYVYSDPEIAAEDQARWTTGIRNRRLVMRSAIMPFETVVWEESAVPAMTNPENLIRLLQQVDGQLGLAVRRGEGANPNWKREADELISRLRAAITNLKGEMS